MDLELNRFDTVFLAPWLDGFLPEDLSYSKLKDRFTHLLVLEQYRDELDRQMSSAAIRETLRRDNLSDVHRSFYIDYQAYRGDAVNWCRVTVTAVDFDEEGTPSTFWWCSRTSTAKRQRRLSIRPRSWRRPSPPVWPTWPRASSSAASATTSAPRQRHSGLPGHGRSGSR